LKKAGTAALLSRAWTSRRDRSGAAATAKPARDAGGAPAARRAARRLMRASE